MDLRELQKYLDAALIGRVLLTESVYPHLEAFSGNALYCGRGMPNMSKYKTVKEVCALTGLTRKHLYYFHHEKVVQAVAYANYSVEGYDGYKLYDDAAVEKLQQIALYYQLGMRRDEIRDIMLDPDYNSNMVLEPLLAMEQAKKVHIERNIAALEYLILAGTKNGVTGSLRGMSLNELGRTLLALRETTAGHCSSQTSSYMRMDTFSKEFHSLITDLGRLDAANLTTPVGAEIIKKIYDLSISNIGVDGVPFILGLFMSALGEGSIAQGISNNLAPSHARAVIQYIIDHPELYSHGSQKTPTGSTGNK